MPTEIVEFPLFIGEFLFLDFIYKVCYIECTGKDYKLKYDMDKKEKNNSISESESYYKYKLNKDKEKSKITGLLVGVFVLFFNCKCN